MRAFWPAPATSADVMAIGDWGLTVTKWRGRHNGPAPWVSWVQQGRFRLLDGLSSASPMVWHSLAKPWVRYLRRSGGKTDGDRGSALSGTKR